LAGVEAMRGDALVKASTSASDRVGDIRLTDPVVLPLVPAHVATAAEVAEEAVPVAILESGCADRLGGEAKSSLLQPSISSSTSFL